MINRVDFERRIAAAMINGDAKLGRVLSNKRALEHARRVADKLSALFTNEDE